MDLNAADSVAAHTSVKGTWAWRAKSAYAAAAHGLGKALTAAHILPAQPPPRQQRIRHWLLSLTKVHDSMAIVELGVPWWTYRAIDAVESWLSHRPRPIRVFEYGSGASTFWLAERADEVFSVEHHPEFSSLIRPELAKRPNVTFLEVPAVSMAEPAVSSRKPGSEKLDFTAYVHQIDTVPGDFDLIVVDGRAREACMRAGAGRLREDGLMVFDNTHRRRYKRAIAASGLIEQVHRGLTPTLPYPDRTSLLRRPAGRARPGAA